MARNIESPGVQINEIDLSFNTSLPVGTNTLINGFAAQGPTMELVNVTSKSELEQIYGAPTTEAERYFYNSCAEVLNSPANLIVNRLPYGEGAGAGIGNNYTGLFYPVTGQQDVALAGGTLSAWIDTVQFDDTSYLITTEAVTGGDISGITPDEYIYSNTFSLYVSSSEDGSMTFSPAYETATDVYFLTSDHPNGATYYDGSINTTDGSFVLSLPGMSDGALNVSAFYTQRTLSGTYSDGYADATYANSSKFVIGAPTLLILTESEYTDIQSGQVSWSQAGTNVTPSLTASNDNLGNAGFIILNKSKVSTDEIAQGYYISIIDSFSANLSGSPQYDSIKAIKTVNASYPTGFFDLSEDAIGIPLTGSETENPNSVSEMMESGWQYDFTDPSYNDSLIVSMFKLRTSNISQDANKIYVGYSEKYVGSLDEKDINRTNPRTLQEESFFLGKTVNTSSGFVDIIVNPNISKKADWSRPGERIGNVTVADEAKAAFSMGTFVSTRGVNTTKIIGEVPAKLEYGLMLAENKDVVDIDLVLEAGLGTIYSYAKIADNANPTDFDPLMDIGVEIDALADPETGATCTIKTLYQVVQDQLQTFVSENRRDCMLIVDPIRGIFVQGEDYKMITRKDKNFSQHIYWPLKNLYSTSNSNYVATYANWVKAFDNASGNFVWMPFSGWQAAIIARMDATSQPWFAPAGLENGIVRNIVDIGINPSQKQRDMLYKVGLNPVVFFPRDAYVVWGQKTLQAKPSAFDRINVRRLFLTLEKATLRLTRYFVMQPNSVFTRTRLVNYLKPIFDIAKQNDGVYDYLLVCDERNNTPTVIDNNELKLDIYIKPVRTAEFILVNFIATRTGADFNELIR